MRLRPVIGGKVLAVSNTQFTIRELGDNAVEEGSVGATQPSRLRVAFESPRALLRLELWTSTASLASRQRALASGAELHASWQEHARASVYKHSVAGVDEVGSHGFQEGHGHRGAGAFTLSLTAFGARTWWIGRPERSS